MRPFAVAPTACTAPGLTTPSTSTPRVVSIIRRCSAGSAAAVAELHATTSSFTRRSTSSSATSRLKRSSSSALRPPYGKRAVSPRYTKSSCGSATSSSWSTVRPPTPESKTPIGRSRGTGVTPPMLSRRAGRRGHGGPPAATSSASPLGVARRGVDRVLELADDGLGQVPVVRLGRRDHCRDQRADEQDHADVLHRPLPRVAAPCAQRPAVQPPHHPIRHLGPPLPVVADV